MSIPFLQRLHVASNLARQGFTLLEIVIYLGLVMVVTIPGVTLLWVLVGDQVKQERFAEVHDVRGAITQTMVRAVRSAQSVNAATLYDVHPGKLVLDYTGLPQTTFETYTTTVNVGGTNVSIRKLRVRVSVVSYDLTSDGVNVDNFLIKNLTSGGATTLEINFSLSAVNPSSSKIYDATETWKTSVTLRH